MALDEFGVIKLPKEAEEPILAPGPRAALHEWLAELNAEDLLKENGLRPRRRALLYGPPGTGKTTMAHHLAARLGLPLLCVQSEDIISASLGSSPKKVAALYDAIRREKGRVALFFDEFDSLATRRKAEQACDTEMANTLNVLLRRMEQDTTTLTFAATNRKDILDPAVWRRFDMQISVDLPGDDERWAILKRYLSPLPVPDADLEAFMSATVAASPALLRQVAEGLKRALLLWPRLRKDVGDKHALFTSVICSVAPPPEMPCPPLWADDQGVADLVDKLQWPWGH